MKEYKPTKILITSNIKNLNLQCKSQEIMSRNEKCEIHYHCNFQHTNSINSCKLA